MHSPVSKGALALAAENAAKGGIEPILLHKRSKSHHIDKSEKNASKGQGSKSNLKTSMTNKLTL